MGTFEERVYCLLGPRHGDGDGGGGDNNDGRSLALRSH